MKTKRSDGRFAESLRMVNISRNVIKYAEGSCLFELGNTKVICTASLEEKQPPFLKDTDRGWITAEYGMLPRSTATRIVRDSRTGRVGGRTHEIQRLVGRSLRGVVDLDKIGKRTIWIDCDVIQADGGTRTASVTGGFVALYDCIMTLIRKGHLRTNPISDFVAATSVGIIDNRIYLDLCYEEDSNADVDMNVVMTEKGKIIEVQGTAEKQPFTFRKLDDMLSFAKKGISELIGMQKKALEDGMI